MIDSNPLPKLLKAYTYNLSFIILAIPFLANIAFAGPNDQNSNFIVQFETGPVWQTTNDVQIPNNEQSTRYSLVDLVGKGPYPSIRLYLTWRITTRQDLRLLLAPLSYTESGIFPSPVSFAGETYQEGDPVDGTYKFNSWRLTYRYKYHNGDRWHWWIGFTAKIRDAKIELEQNGNSSKKTDLGFVPLLHLRGEYHFKKPWWIFLDIDALAGGPGRAIDGTFQMGYDFSDRWGITAGYRTVEGGADVDEVYNFAWLHYIVASLNYAF